ncbi:MAG: tRNA (adenosine(37)-N6)-threonylcarbamoyltransferase complex dimerization subunit type 1 TsaB [Planctomycetes bacterium]|nr:tRNA (adenosine(37)-N6)-threonylcarbamoyltransferase complex dimerization subunit type 1 TsaB [Planctomycetota bacterium]
MNGIILAIESSGDGGGAAVLRDGEIDSEAEVSGPRRHGSELMPCIDKVCLDAAINRGDMDVIAVNCGPGSYTGLRIGLATAATLGFALDKPVAGIPCFDAMVLQYVMADDFDVELKRELWPVLDARRDEVMTARFEYDNGAFKRATADMLVAPEKLHEQAQRQAIVFGSGVAPYADKFNHDHLVVDGEEFGLKPSSVALAAYRQLADVEDAGTLERKLVEPRYFRRVLAKTIEERASEV